MLLAAIVQRLTESEGTEDEEEPEELKLAKRLRESAALHLTGAEGDAGEIQGRLDPVVAEILGAAVRHRRPCPGQCRLHLHVRHLPPREHSDVEFKGGGAPPPPHGRGMIRQAGAVSEVLVLESQVNFLRAFW